MNRVERKLLYRTVALGFLLTLTVLAVDHVGKLATLERWLWDRRARVCQFFTPPPTDQLLHLMIDDESLQTIGAWPWPRATLAGIVDELSLAGAKVIALDMFFPEPQEVTIRKQLDGATVEIDNDAIFADSIRRAGNVLLPVSLELSEQSGGPIRQAAQNELERDLELPLSQLPERLVARGFRRESVNQELNATEALKLAILSRIEQQASAATQPSDVLRDRLLPRFAASGVTSDASHLFPMMLDTASAIRTLRKFGKNSLPATPLLTTSVEKAVTIQLLTSAASESGSVDLLPPDDGTIRWVPLWMCYRGMAWPTMPFSLACHLLGADPRQCRIEPDRVVIPLPGGGERNVPVRTVYSTKLKQEVGTAFNIPWFGNIDWMRMYDRSGRPNFLPVKAVWSITQLQRDIDANDAELDDAILALARTYQIEPALKFLQIPRRQRTQEARAAAVQAVRAVAIDDSGAAETLRALETADARTLTEEDQKYLSAAHALVRVGQANAAIAARLAEARAQVRQYVNGRGVLFGWSATGRLDTYITSLHPACPGSVVQGAVVNAIVTGEMLRSAPIWVQHLVTVTLGLLSTLAVARLNPWGAFFAALMLAVCYGIVNGIVLYDWGNVIVGAAGPLVACGMVWALLTLSKFINEARERSRITRRFRGYVDPAIVDVLVENPDQVRFDGEVREMTICFTDLAGFTTISERLQEKTVPLLNDYMGRMMPIIRRNNGTWNKFLGDGIMFFYNAPLRNDNHTCDAIQTVLEMQIAVAALNKDLAEKGLPEVTMRAGIARGDVVVGDAGSIQGDYEAFDYTVLGDRVNLAARLEAANKAFGTSTLIEARAHEFAKQEYLFRPIGSVKVKGKDEGVQLFEPLCRRSDANEAQNAEAAAYTTMVDAYQRGDLECCRQTIEQIRAEFGDKRVLSTYARLCDEFQHPEKRSQFTGDIVLTEK